MTYVIRSYCAKDQMRDCQRHAINYLSSQLLPQRRHAVVIDGTHLHLEGVRREPVVLAREEEGERRADSCSDQHCLRGVASYPGFKALLNVLDARPQLLGRQAFDGVGKIGDVLTQCRKVVGHLASGRGAGRLLATKHVVHGLIVFPPCLTIETAQCSVRPAHAVVKRRRVAYDPALAIAVC